MGKVISIINMKGGVGKTTLAVNLAYTLVKNHNCKVLLIDTDPQMNSTQYAINLDEVLSLMNQKGRTIVDLFKNNANITFTSVINNFDLFPSNINLMSMDLVNKSEYLSNFIKFKNLKDKYDLIIIDAPPTLSDYTSLSLRASDEYIVPITDSFLSLMGLMTLEMYMSRIFKEKFDHKCRFSGIIVNMVNPALIAYKNQKEHLNGENRWKEKLFLSEISYSTDAVKGLNHPKPEKRFFLNLRNPKLSKEINDLSYEFYNRVILEKN